jgi:hypothetical protein
LEFASDRGSRRDGTLGLRTIAKRARTPPSRDWTAAKRQMGDEELSEAAKEPSGSASLELLDISGR